MVFGVVLFKFKECIVDFMGGCIQGNLCLVLIGVEDLQWGGGL